MTRNPSSRGFTLIELLISVAIFAIVMVSVSAAYLNLVNLDKQARATDDLTNNLSFAMDSMARAIRTGTQYQCGGPGGSNCTTPSSEFTFVNSSGVTVTYILNTTTHQIGECTGATCSTAAASYITDPRISIDSLQFYVTGATRGDQFQPIVVFTIHGTLQTGSNHVTTFVLQTSSTERGIDI
jgi:prepilin-type N-terminal cleavage/methylation domain-containing protein